eukprot:5455728-Prymnesium_polylepis.1
MIDAAADATRPGSTDERREGIGEEEILRAHGARATPAATVHQSKVLRCGMTLPEMGVLLESLGLAGDRCTRH